MPIRIDNATFAYPSGEPAVEEVSLTVSDGERVAVIGQNGAGKTTLVKLMNGLLKPQSGDVRVDGTSTIGRTTAQVARTVGYVFQNPDDQIFSSTVRDELDYLPKYRKLDRAERDSRVAVAARLTGLEPWLDHNPNDLPFAIRKFVAVAAILTGDCRYVILDEPTAGLDSRGIAQLTSLMDHLRDEGIAVVYITHDMRFVLDTAERVVAMADRRVVADGLTSEVFADDEVLSRSRVRRPEALQLAHELGLVPEGSSIGAVVDAIEMHRSYSPPTTT